MRSARALAPDCPAHGGIGKIGPFVNWHRAYNPFVGLFYRSEGPGPPPPPFFCFVCITKPATGHP